MEHDAMTSTQIDFLRQLFNQYDPTITWKSAPTVQELVEALKRRVYFEHHFSTEFACRVMEKFFEEVNFEELAVAIINDWYDGR